MLVDDEFSINYVRTIMMGDTYQFVFFELLFDAPVLILAGRDGLFFSKISK